MFDAIAQSAPVFGFAHWLRIQLLPRISNWKDMIFEVRDDSRTLFDKDPLQRPFRAESGTNSQGQV